MNEELQPLIDAAKQENWDLVDERITDVAKDPTVIGWAYDVGLSDQNPHVRDLAASILEKGKIQNSVFESMRPTLYRVMTTDDHVYARYRSAFALAVHGPGNYKADVKRVLEEAEQDDAVSKLAKQYLARLN